VIYNGGVIKAEQPAPFLPNLAWTSTELHQWLNRALVGLVQSLGDVSCYFFGLRQDQNFAPVHAAGCSSEDQVLFSSVELSSKEDSLLRRMLAHPETITFGQEANLRHPDGSVLTKLLAQSAVAVPVLSGPEIIAILIVTRSASAKEFSSLEITQIEWLAQAITPAIESTLRYHKMKERLAESEALHQVTLAILQKSGLDEAIKTICEEAMKMTSSCGASLALIENSSWLRMMYVTGETPDKPGRLRASRSHLGRAIHHRTEPLIINHSAERPNFLPRLAIPLVVRGSTIGSLTLFRKADFGAEDVRLMRIFAEQSAIAIDHAQLTSFSQEMSILQERHRLSRELHDSVNQLLYGISLYNEAATRQMDQGNLEAARRYLKNIEESGQAALKEMRMLIFGLRPSGLTQMGLQASLAQRLKSVEEKLGLQHSLKWRVVSQLEPNIEEGLYGIAQEALNNVIRHAQARSVSIRLSESEQRVTMTIKDDGVGFDPDSISSGGMGLKTMRERAASLNARLRIESQPNQGTRVIVEIVL